MSNKEFVHLRAWHVNDLENVFQMRNDIPLQRLLMARAVPETRDNVLSWLKKKSKDKDSVFLLIALDSDDSAIGYVQANRIDLENGKADFGICIAQNAQGKGFGLQSCELFHEHLKSEFGIKKLILKVLSNNSRAISLYRRIGYCDIEIIKNHHFESGKYYDVLVMEFLLT